MEDLTLMFSSLKSVQYFSRLIIADYLHKMCFSFKLYIKHSKYISDIHKKRVKLFIGYEVHHEWNMLNRV